MVRTLREGGLPRLDAEGEECCSKLLPGSYVMVWYSDDNVWHERLCLWPLGRYRWIIYTPDRDLYVEEFGGGGDGPEKIRLVGPRGGVGGVRGGMYCFPSRPDEGQLRKLILEAAAESEHEVVEGPAPDKVFLQGREAPLEPWLGRVPPAAQPPAALPVAPAGAAGTGVGAHASVWLACEPADGIEPGAEINVGPGDLIHGDVAVHFGPGFLFGVRCVKCEVGAAAERAEELRQALHGWAARHRAPHGGLEPGLAERLRAGRGDDAPKAPATAEGDDVRTLWVEYDEQGERYKPWRMAVRESTSESFSDSPLEGPPTVLHLAKHYDRHGGDPRQWLQIWAREKKIENTDRILHELRVLVDTRHFAGTFDQLNLGSLVCLGVVARRIQLVVGAYSGPQRPNWEATRLFSGQPLVEDGASPALRSLVARKAKEESEIVNVRVRARELRGAGGGRLLAPAAAEAAASAGEAVEGGALPAAGRGRGKKLSRALGPAAGSS